MLATGGTRRPMRQLVRVTGGTRWRERVKDSIVDTKFVTVWCGFWVEGIIGPYLFENEARAAV